MENLSLFIFLSLGLTAVVLRSIAIKQNFGEKAEEPKVRSLDKS